MSSETRMRSRAEGIVQFGNPRLSLVERHGKLKYKSTDCVEITILGKCKKHS